MMKKLLTATLITALSTHALNAGGGSSTMQAEEEKAPAKKASPQKSAWESPEVKTLAAGAAILAGAFVAYKTYNSSTSAETNDDSFSSSSSGYDSEPDSYDFPKQSYQQTEDINSFKRQLNPNTIIDLTVYVATFDYENRRYESARVDLHPVYNTNPRKYLRQEIFEKQRAYHLGQTSDDKVHIITGTGKNRPGPNYTLQNNVETWLQEDFIQKRIKKYWKPQEGIFTVLLKQHIS